MEYRFFYIATMPVLFFFVIAIASSVFAKDWAHYSGQSEVRSAVKASDGTIWAAFAWGIQERSPKGQIVSYTPGNQGLEAVDFVQIFSLPNGDIIAASKNGTLVRKNKNSNRFENINTSFVEKKRNLLTGLGKHAKNILVLPFEDAIAFFDYEQNRSVITLLQIGSSLLGTYPIKKVVVKDDSIWLDLDSFVWKRQINWSEIHKDNFLADPMSWIEVKDKKIPLDEENKISVLAGTLNNFPLQRVKTISLHGSDAVAWGNEYNFFSRMHNDEWGWQFWANVSGFGDDQNNYITKSLALHPSGNFAVGMWGPGLLIFNNAFPEAKKDHWFHSSNTGNTCPTEWSNIADIGWTIVQGLVLAPDLSGYIFSYVSQDKYGLGFVDNSGKKDCKKSDLASAPASFAIIVKANEIGEWEIYVSWKPTSLSKEGGIDLYKISNPKNFNPAFIKKWSVPFGAPIDFAFDSQGVLWAVSEYKIFYLDEKDDEWKEPSYIHSFSGGDISALEADAQNGLWIGTKGDGAYSFSQKNNSPDSLIAKNFKIKDGLLNELVYDIAIDTIKGKVYFGHDLGLSVYSTALVRSASDYMQSGAPKVIAYPNPFRPNLHSHVTIDFVNEKSSVYILDSSGKRVRIFKGNDLRGGRAVWDGKNESGKLVAPGLYHYVAADGKNTTKGKIIIER
jgi:hypothetical protein